MTRRAICKLEPIATAIAKSILSLTATVTAVTCSLAFPTMGNRMSAMNVLDNLPDPSGGEILNSTQMSTKAMDTARVKMATHRLNCDVFV